MKITTNAATENSRLHSCAVLYTRHESATIVAQLPANIYAELLPLIGQEGGPIPGLPDGVFHVESAGAGNHFKCRHGGSPVLLGGVALNETEAEKLWSVLLDLVRHLPGSMPAGTTLEQPTQLPWVTFLMVPPFLSLAVAEQTQLVACALNLADTLVRFHQTKGKCDRT